MTPQGARVVLSAYIRCVKLIRTNSSNETGLLKKNRLFMLGLSQTKCYTWTELQTGVPMYISHACVLSRRDEFESNYILFWIMHINYNLSLGHDRLTAITANRTVTDYFRGNRKLTISSWQITGPNRKSKLTKITDN